MRVQNTSLPTLTEIRRHILHVLCTHGQVDPDGTELKEAVVERSGKPYGLFFHIQAPPLGQLSAIWSASEKHILFYDRTGHLFAETTGSAVLTLDLSPA
jgi:hypothetical protein